MRRTLILALVLASSNAAVASAATVVGAPVSASATATSTTTGTACTATLTSTSAFNIDVPRVDFAGSVDCKQLLPTSPAVTQIDQFMDVNGRIDGTFQLVRFTGDTFYGPSARQGVGLIAEGAYEVRYCAMLTITNLNFVKPLCVELVTGGGA